MTHQLIVCHLFCCTLHSVLVSGRLEFDPQPQQILFLRKYSLICSVLFIAVFTVIHEIWRYWRTVKGYTCLHDFNNSVSYNMSIMRISEVEAILTAFCTWLCNFVAVICRWAARGAVVFKALRYKPAGRGFDSRWCQDFSP